MNWYRTFHTTKNAEKLWIIPNFAHIANLDQIDRIDYQGDIRVIFARRFVPFRGTIIFAEVVKEILSTIDNVYFTFAGVGPEEAYLRGEFAGNPKVSFLSYLPNEALDIHLTQDIAVVPSIASEGTSLAVAEAMGAGCAVVASGVGGITNMIIDGYNGLLAMPNASSLLLCLKRVIENKELRQKLARNGYATAKEAFSIEVWRERWNHVLDEVNESKV